MWLIRQIGKIHASASNRCCIGRSSMLSKNTVGLILSKPYRTVWAMKPSPSKVVVAKFPPLHRAFTGNVAPRPPKNSKHGSGSNLADEIDLSVYRKIYFYPHGASRNGMNRFYRTVAPVLLGAVCITGSMAYITKGTIIAPEVQQFFNIDTRFYPIIYLVLICTTLASYRLSKDKWPSYIYANYHNSPKKGYDYIAVFPGVLGGRPNLVKFTRRDISVVPLGGPLLDYRMVFYFKFEGKSYAIVRNMFSSENDFNTLMAAAPEKQPTAKADQDRISKIDWIEAAYSAILRDGRQAFANSIRWTYFRMFR